MNRVNFHEDFWKAMNQSVASEKNVHNQEKVNEVELDDETITSFYENTEEGVYKESNKFGLAELLEEKSQESRNSESSVNQVTGEVVNHKLGNESLLVDAFENSQVGEDVLDKEIHT